MILDSGLLFWATLQAYAQWKVACLQDGPKVNHYQIINNSFINCIKTCQWYYIFLVK